MYIYMHVFIYGKYCTAGTQDINFAKQFIWTAVSDRRRPQRLIQNINEKA